MRQIEVCRPLNVFHDLKSKEVLFKDCNIVASLLTRIVIIDHQLNRILQQIKHNKNKFLIAFEFFLFQADQRNATAEREISDQVHFYFL